MSTDRVQQSTPIIIKGGRQSSLLQRAIEIHANSVFEVTEQFHAQPQDWVQSDSGFTISYVESVVVGAMGTQQQFCQTAKMTHPLTYEFKDSSNNNIFTISEVDVNGGGNYSLHIAVSLPNDYFQITESPKSDDPNWTVSTFDALSAEVYAVEVVDADSIPVCRLLRTGEEDIILNMEPAK